MNLAHQAPFQMSIDSFKEIVDDMMNKSLADLVGIEGTPAKPPVNIKQKEDRYILELAVPGIEKENIKLTIEGKQLKISNNKEKTIPEAEEKYERREFNFTTFQRKFSLPDKVDTSNISANLKNGVLTILLYKKVITPEQTNEMTIPIQG